MGLYGLVYRIYRVYMGIYDCIVYICVYIVYTYIAIVYFGAMFMSGPVNYRQLM